MRARTLALTLSALVLIAGSQPAWADGRDPADEMRTVTFHGVTFEHPQNLQTRPCYETQPAAPCLVLFDPAQEDWISVLLSIDVHDGPLEAVAAEHAGFVRQTDGRLMTTYGRFMPMPVEAFEINGRSALRATNSCGISDPETGFHAGAGECLTVVISDGRRTVIVGSSGFHRALEPTEALLPTIRFAPSE